MYAKLLLGNLRNNFRDYAIYFFTVALSVAVFYAFNTISLQADFLSQSLSDIFELMGQMLQVLTYGLAIILGFLMVYANNYLVKRRKKEFGLYELLGMRRSSVSLMMTGETLLCFLLAFGAGIGLGVVLSQFLIFISAFLFHDSIKAFHFIFSVSALQLVAICFALTFCVTLVLNLLTLKKVNLEKLLKGDRTNETPALKRPWIALLVGGAGIVCICIACIRFMRDGFPIEAINNGSDKNAIAFCITTCLMIVGTYLVFFAGPSLFVWLSAHTKRFYYKGLRMFTIRQVASRITSNSLSMGTVCLVLFLAITSVSTGMGIAIGTSTDLERTVPYTASVSGSFQGESGKQKIAPQNQGGYIPDVLALLQEHGLDVHAFDTQAVQANFFWDPTVLQAFKVAKEDFYRGDPSHAANLLPETAPTLENFARYGSTQERDALLSASSGIAFHPLSLEPLSSYNATAQMLGYAPLELGENEYALTANVGGSSLISMLSAAMEQKCAVSVGNTTLFPKGATPITDKSAAITNMGFGSNQGTIIVPDRITRACVPYSFSVQMLSPPKDADAFQAYMSAQEENYNKAHTVASDAEGNAARDLTSNVEQNATSDAEKSQDTFRTFGASPVFISLIGTQNEIVKGAQSMTGIVGYLAVYIGFVLVMSVAAIVAIQMLTNVADSVGRYRLLSDLGTPYKLLNKTLIAQVCFYFLLPLALGLFLAGIALTQVQRVAGLLVPFDMIQSCLFASLVFLSVYGLYLLICYVLSKDTVWRAL